MSTKVPAERKKTKRVETCLTAEVDWQLRQEAALEMISRSVLLRQLIEAWLAERRPRPAPPAPSETAASADRPPGAQGDGGKAILGTTTDLAAERQRLLAGLERTDLEPDSKRLISEWLRGMEPEKG